MGKTLGLEFFGIKTQARSEAEKHYMDQIIPYWRILFRSISFTLKSKPLIQPLNYNSLSKKLPRQTIN